MSLTVSGPEAPPAVLPVHDGDLAVAAVVRRADGRYLLVRRAEGRPAAGWWTPVTGRPEPGETLEAAARRECLEEVGLTVDVGAEVYRCPTVGAAFTLVWFDARVDAETREPMLTLKIDEVDDALWLTAAEACALDPMFPATRDFYAARRDREGERSG